MRSLLVALAVLVSVSASLRAQNFTLDGYQNCQRATNGRAYC